MFCVIEGLEDIKTTCISYFLSYLFHSMNKDFQTRNFQKSAGVGPNCLTLIYSHPRVYYVMSTLPNKSRSKRCYLFPWPAFGKLLSRLLFITIISQPTEGKKSLEFCSWPPSFTDTEITNRSKAFLKITQQIHALYSSHIFLKKKKNRPKNFSVPDLKE